MGNIADKLASLAETKRRIAAAIRSKGVAVSDTAPFRSYPGLILTIPASGGGTDNVFTVTTSAGKSIVDKNTMTVCDMSAMAVESSAQ